MRLALYIVPVILCLLVGCDAGDHAYSGTLRIYTAEQYEGLVRAQSAAFQRLYPEVRVRVVPTTTREAVVALARDSADVVLLDRPLNEEERTALSASGREPAEVPVATDALIFVTGAGSARSEITLREVRAHFMKGQATVATGLNSGTNELLARRYLGLPGGLRPARRPARQREVPLQVSPDALGMMTMSALTDSLRARVRVLAIRTDSGLVAPSPLAVYRAEYPLRVPVSYYAAASAGDLASGFLSFTRSTYGQKLVQKAGLAPLSLASRPIQFRHGVVTNP